MAAALSAAVAPRPARPPGQSAIEWPVPWTYALAALVPVMLLAAVWFAQGTAPAAHDALATKPPQGTPVPADQRTPAAVPGPAVNEPMRHDAATTANPEVKKPQPPEPQDRPPRKLPPHRPPSPPADPQPPDVAGLDSLGRNAAGHLEYRNPKDRSTLILIPAGRFQMGCPDGWWDERPVHAVELQAYLIGKYEVTNREYRAFCAATGHEPPPAPARGEGCVNYFADPRYADHPVVNVNWEEAQAYARWAGLRLPTEAQWERAAAWDATAGRSRAYPWGPEAPRAELANTGHATGSGSYTLAVGSLPKGASPCGALDICGSVYAWCADWYLGGSYAPGTAVVQDPTGPERGEDRVLRGGGCFNSAWDPRIFKRSTYDPGLRYPYLGFRVARPLRVD